VIKLEKEKYLFDLGSRLQEIRKLYGWRQEDAANRIGISRSKVVTIEKDPEKFTVCDAQSLFVACDYELYKAKRTLDEIKLQKNKKLMSKLIVSSIFLTSPFFASTIMGAAIAIKPKTVSKFIPVLNSVFGSVWATSTAKSKREKQIEKLANEDVLDFNSLEKSMKSTILEIEKSLLQIFELTDMDSRLFYEQLHSELKLQIHLDDNDT